MKAEIEVELRPFAVPDLVFQAKATHDPRAYKLAELSSETLEELCADFRLAVFQKAGKEYKA